MSHDTRFAFTTLLSLSNINKLPDLNVVQDLAVFQERTVQYLIHISQGTLQYVKHVAPWTLQFTPALLGSYMQLFCNAIRLHMLARGMPRALIVQLHTLLVNLVQARMTNQHKY